MNFYSGGTLIKKNNNVGRSEVEIYGLDNKYQGFLSFPHYYTYNNENIMYAAVDHSTVRGLVESRDLGKTWRVVHSIPGIIPLSSYRIPGSAGLMLFWYVQGGVHKLDLLKNGALQKSFEGMKNPFNPDLSIIRLNANTFVYAEYTSQGNKVWKTSNAGNDWEVLYEVKDISHIHSLQADPYTGVWWMCCGDFDAEPRILKSEDEGVTWEIVAGAQEGVSNQQFRVCGMGFTESYIIYGTDAVGDGEINRIYKTGKDSFDPQIVGEIEGTVFGIYRGVDGNFYLHAMGEGPDEYSRIYVTNGINIKEILKTYRTDPPRQGGINRMTKPDIMNRAMFGNKDSWNNSLGLMSLPFGKV